MEITLLIVENHGKIMELCFQFFLGTLCISSSVTETEVEGGILKCKNPEKHCLWLKRNIQDIEKQDSNFLLSRYIGKLLVNTCKEIQFSLNVKDDLEELPHFPLNAKDDCKMIHFS